MSLIEANLISTICAFSRAGDLSNLTFFAHSERVAYISLRLGQKLQLSQGELGELLLSALLHDIGIATGAEQLRLADLEPLPGHVAPHCQRGHDLLGSTKLFGPYARNVLEHHDYYSPKLRIIPAIIHLADRVDIMLDKRRYILWQVEDLLDYFQTNQGVIFCPHVMEAFRALAKIPSFWLDLEHGYYQAIHQEYEFQRILTLDELEEIAQLLATLVDSKSPFTANHSRGVANAAALLGRKLNKPEPVVGLLRIAGLLHDIGKLAIPDEILLAPGALDRRQREFIKQHTYHSYHLISKIGPGAETIARWAAYHHEKLDGSGYPFALSAADLDEEARLMAVIDITCSLLEARPYREALSKDKVMQILHNNVQANHLDSRLTELTIAHLDEIVELVL